MLDKKDNWLTRLEEESWQAELIISGAAIFGCLQLPGAMQHIEDLIFVTINREGMMLWYMIMLFANMLTYVLIITFILHFVMRALWIGMVGFNSAYPKGFKPNEHYSEDFQRRLREDFGDTHAYIERLDQRCSTIFGVGFAIALLALGYINVTAILGLVAYFLRTLISANSVFYVMIGAFGFIMIFSVASMVMNFKSIRNHPFVMKYHYPVSQVVGKALMNIGYRPASYVMNVLASEMATSKVRALLFFLGSALIGGAGALLGTRNMDIGVYIDSVYHWEASDPSTISPRLYADQDFSDRYTFKPVIKSYEMQSDELFTVFLPLPNREKFEMEGQCKLPEPSSERTSEGRNSRRKHIVDCARQYYRLYLNDQEVDNYDLSRHWYGPKEQYGFLATLPDPELQSGKNILRIESNYFNDQAKPRTALIPFYRK